MPDIDIDLQTTFNPLTIFNTAVPASMVRDNELVKHNVGIYFQNISVDSLTGLAAIPYQQAEEVGYFKIDFLHLSLLDIFESKEEIRELLTQEPDWTLLQDNNVVQKLFQIHRHGEILKIIKPASVQELADCISLIRPGKRHLIDKYIQDKEATRKELYKNPGNGQYYFKRSHAISYSLTIVLQLHLIKGGVV